MNEYMVWLKDGRTVIVRANTVVVRSTQVLFMGRNPQYYCVLFGSRGMG